jgi:hypothetical protein
VVVGLGKVICVDVVGDAVEIVSVRWRVFWVNLALERSRGRQLDSCWRCDVDSSTLWRSLLITGDSFIIWASRFEDGVTSCTAGKRLYCFFFLSVFGGDSGLSSSNGRGDNGINCISSSSAPDFASSDVLVASLRSPSPKSKRSIAVSPTTRVAPPTGRFGLCAGDGSWM